MDWFNFWQRRGAANAALLPAAALFAAAAAARRAAYARGVFARRRVGVPVVVVGNAVAGGGGKTPTTIALVAALRARGLRVGVASRGYGGRARAAALLNKNSDWRQCGDEPLLIFRQTGAPVATGKNRAKAAALLADAGCEIVVCDDGLQHYALRRDLEICVVNGEYGFGNGWRLPAGPLREPPTRAATCDFCLVVGAQAGGKPAANLPANALAMPAEYGAPYPLDNPQGRLTPAQCEGKRVAAVAGIARPQSFFNALRRLGFNPQICLPLADHAVLSPAKLAALPADIVILTEKDAIKYNTDDPRLHALPWRCQLPAEVAQRAAQLCRPAPPPANHDTKQTAPARRPA